MIIDVTGTILTPGNGGRDCRGNGRQINRIGIIQECCCNECAYMLCCIDKHCADKCKNCTDKESPRAGK